MNYKLYISISVLLLLLVVGTYAYHSIEGWGYIDSLYFSVITLSTIGYGNGLYPVTTIGKLFTVVYILVGVSMTLVVLTSVSVTVLEQKFMKKVAHNIKMSEGEVKYGKNRTFHKLRKKLLGD